MAFPIIQKYKKIYLCILYLLQAIPQGLIYFSIQDWLTGNGFSIKDIALITAIASVPWSLKFLIAPFIDCYSKSSMGGRRSWILFSIFFLASTILSAAFITTKSLQPLILGLVFFTSLLATSILDVSTDGLAIDILDKDERGTVNGMMWASRTFGLSLSGISSAYIMKQYGLTIAVVFVGIFIFFFGILLSIFKENKNNKYLSFKILRIRNNQLSLNIKEIIKVIFISIRKNHIPLLLLFCLSSNIASGIHFSSISYLYTNYANWNSFDITYYRSVALYGGVIAAFLGGYLSDKINSKIIIGISHVTLSFLCLVIATYTNLIKYEFFGISILLALSFFNSFALTAVLSICMKFSFSSVAASLFAIFMSSRHLSRIIGESLAVFFDGLLGLSVSFIYLITAIFALLPLIFIRYLNPYN